MRAGLSGFSLFHSSMSTCRCPLTLSSRPLRMTSSPFSVAAGSFARGTTTVTTSVTTRAATAQSANQNQGVSVARNPASQVVRVRRGISGLTLGAAKEDGQNLGEPLVHGLEVGLVACASRSHCHVRHRRRRAACFAHRYHEHPYLLAPYRVADLSGRKPARGALTICQHH